MNSCCSILFLPSIHATVMRDKISFLSEAAATSNIATIVSSSYSLLNFLPLFNILEKIVIHALHRPTYKTEKNLTPKLKSFPIIRLKNTIIKFK